MTENTHVSQDAAAVVEALRQRGVRLIARGKKGLEVQPKSAYAALSQAERVFLKVHRAEVIAALKESPHVATPTAQPAPAPRVERCAYCGQAPCIGPDHDAFRVLHFSDPKEVERRREEATKVMLESLRRAREGGDPNIR